MARALWMIVTNHPTRVCLYLGLCLSGSLNWLALLNFWRVRTLKLSQFAACVAEASKFSSKCFCFALMGSSSGALVLGDENSISITFSCSSRHLIACAELQLRSSQ